MPERHSSGENSGSSSSGSSSGSSWSGSSSSSGSSWRDYGNREPLAPEDRMWALAILAIIAACWMSIQVLNAIHKGQVEAQNAAATVTTQAITIADLKQMHHALDERIEIWKRDTTDTGVHRVEAAVAGFGPETNTKEVDYGYCDKDYFYVYILESSQPGGFRADTEGYYYSTGLGPQACHPENWTVISLDPVESGWYFITLSTYSATYAARPTSTVISATVTSTAAP